MSCDVNFLAIGFLHISQSALSFLISSFCGQHFTFFKNHRKTHSLSAYLLSSVGEDWFKTSLVRVRLSARVILEGFLSSDVRCSLENGLKSDMTDFLITLWGWGWGWGNPLMSIIHIVASFSVTDKVPFLYVCFAAF